MAEPLRGLAVFRAMEMIAARSRGFVPQPEGKMRGQRLRLLVLDEAAEPSPLVNARWGTSDTRLLAMGSPADGNSWFDDLLAMDVQAAAGDRAAAALCRWQERHPDGAHGPEARLYEAALRGAVTRGSHVA